MPKIRLQAKPASLEKSLEFISKAAKKKGFSEQRMKEVELAMEEVLVNIFNYAYPENPGEVQITEIKNQDTGLIFEIRDHGTPFNPLTRSDPEFHAPVSDREVGGLGVFFIREMANELRYRREGDSNILTLIFSR